MKQFRDVMEYNQAFRQMLLCLEDMSMIDELSHYERGLEPKFRIAVRQARCVDVSSAMAEVDIVADAHKVNVIMPHSTTPTQVHSAVPHMGVEPMQISVLQNNKKYRTGVSHRLVISRRMDPVRDGTIIMVHHRHTRLLICLK